MLALDDAALARFAIAATAVARHQRGRWLEQLALSVYHHLHSTEGTIQAEKSRPNIQKIAGFQKIAIQLPKPVSWIWNIKAKATPKYEQYNSESE